MWIEIKGEGLVNLGAAKRIVNHGDYVAIHWPNGVSTKWPVTYKTAKSKLVAKPAKS